MSESKFIALQLPIESAPVNPRFKVGDVLNALEKDWLVTKVIKIQAVLFNNYTDNNDCIVSIDGEDTNLVVYPERYITDYYTKQTL